MNSATKYNPYEALSKVWENTDKRILKEIIVVDDGSRPPLRKVMSASLGFELVGLFGGLGFRV